MTPARTNQNWLPSIFNEFLDNNWLAERRNATAPAVNIIEDEDEYKVEVAAPGMTREDFKGEILARNLLNYYRAFEADQASPRYPLTDRERNLIESQLGYFSLFEEDEKDDIRTALDILDTSPSAFSIVPLPDLDNE